MNSYDFFKNAEDEVSAIINGLIPKDCVVRCREGAGPENIFGTLSLSVAKMRSDLERLRVQVNSSKELPTAWHRQASVCTPAEGYYLKHCANELEAALRNRRE